MRLSRFLLLAVLILALPVASLAQFGVSITIAPPALPVYTQPMAPADGYLWTPGYWAYGDEGYFWVPGHMGDGSRGWHALDSRLFGVGAVMPTPGMVDTGARV